MTREGTGIELRRGVFEVSVDGRSVASVKSHETVETPLEAGDHTITIEKGRYSSRPESFRAADGEVVNFRCHGAMMWPSYVASILKPDTGISLRRE